MEGVSEYRGTYKVMMVSESSQEEGILEIYDSTSKSWRIERHLTHDIHIDNKEIVFCSISFYCLVSILYQQGIMGFNIREVTYLFSPLLDMDDRNNMSPYLLACGPWVQAVGYIFGNNEELS